MTNERFLLDLETLERRCACPCDDIQDPVSGGKGREGKGPEVTCS